MAFILSIKSDSGKEFQLKPGGQLERDLVHAIVSKLSKRGIGLLRHKSKVLREVRSAIEDVIHEAKSEILP